MFVTDMYAKMISLLMFVYAAHIVGKTLHLDPLPLHPIHCNIVIEAAASTRKQISYILGMSNPDTFRFINFYKYNETHQDWKKKKKISLAFWCYILTICILIHAQFN